MADKTLEQKLQLVEERLEFVDLISGLKKHFTNPSLTRTTPDGGWMHPWLYFDALRNYLLLTCFDLLGQPTEYVPFNTWLVSSRHEGERTDALKKIAGLDSPLEITKKLYEEYNALYGIKNSFFNFIDTLPITVQEELFYSLKIEETLNEDRPDGSVLPTCAGETSDKASKKKVLYEIRNNYTHKLKNSGSGAGGIWPDIDDGILIDGVIKKGWGHIYSEPRKEFKPNIRRYKVYSVRDWPNVLIHTVRAGMNVKRPRA
jgi:hypothetical protein